MKLYVVHCEMGEYDEFTQWVDSIWSEKYLADEHCFFIKSTQESVKFSEKVYSEVQEWGLDCAPPRSLYV